MKLTLNDSIYALWFTLFFGWYDDLKFMQNYIMSECMAQFKRFHRTEPFLRLDFQLNPFNAI